MDGEKRKGQERGMHREVEKRAEGRQGGGRRGEMEKGRWERQGRRQRVDLTTHKCILKLGYILLTCPVRVSYIITAINYRNTEINYVGVV